MDAFANIPGVTFEVWSDGYAPLTLDDPSHVNADGTLVVGDLAEVAHIPFFTDPAMCDGTTTICVSEACIESWACDWTMVADLVMEPMLVPDAYDPFESNCARGI